jgi:hypothetical protein
MRSAAIYSIYRLLRESSLYRADRCLSIHWMQLLQTVSVSILVFYDSINDWIVHLSVNVYKRESIDENMFGYGALTEVLGIGGSLTWKS